MLLTIVAGVIVGILLAFFVLAWMGGTLVLLVVPAAALKILYKIFSKSS